MANRLSGPAYLETSATGAATGAVFATAAFFAAFFTVFFVAFAGAFFTATFFLATFFDDAFAASARTLAHRFFVAATILAIPSLLIRRFGFAATFAGAGSDSWRIAAQRFCWLFLIFRRVAAENARRLRGVDSEVAAMFASFVPGSIERTSAIWASMRVFWL